MRILNFVCAILCSCLFFSTAQTGIADEQTAEGSAAENAERDFTLRVLPLITAKCLACHGDPSNDLEGDFDVRSREWLLKGGESEGPSIVPGDPDASPFYRAVMWDGFEMPPKENDRLTEEQTEIIRKWIRAGAPWPDEETQELYRQQERLAESNEEGVIFGTSGGLADDWTYRRYQPEDLWAFRPVQHVDVPNDEHPIDKLVQRQWDAAGVVPALEADSLTLIRRVTFDLHGLPPTPNEIRDFQSAWKQNSEEAWAELIDRLLASHRYGERWGQHWLDVTRYADTGGMSNDYERSNMWRYRDYVIRSFNQNKPYNEFIVEQLAGDELWEQQPTVSKNSELLIATGFLRAGPWDNAMVEPEEARQLYLDDVVNSVGQTFLSTTLRCVKCHDHKFDPIPTRDYYRIYAVFAGTQMAERPAPFLPKENQQGFEESRAMTRRLLEYASEKNDKLLEKQEAAARQWYQENGSEYVALDDREDLPDEVKPPRYIGLSTAEAGRLKVRKQDEWIWKRRLERYLPMAQSVYNGSTPEKLTARKLRMPKKDNEKFQLVSHIYTGGSLEAPGEEVQPGVLSATRFAVNPVADDPWLIDSRLSGRRLAFARWVADPRNPLTSRSIVNRIWQHHFGKAIAGNPNSFGAKGRKPTHPELLDWLAQDFVEHGWTFKRLHRNILMSKVYRQSTRHPQIERLKTIDPENNLLAWFPTRRLTAEEVRDSMLKITGELNTTEGGIPVRPEINMEVALQPRMIQFSLAPAWQPSPTPQQRNRRSIYTYRVRGQADPFLEVFNQPNPNESCDLRDAAAVSPQAFTLMNSELMSDRAIAFARRIQSEANTSGARVQRAFQLAFGRRATADEQQRLVQYVQRMLEYHETVRPEPVVFPTEISRSLVEELSGKPFTYQEILPVFENYVADAKPADVDAQTRAWSDLCLVLFNSNEFLYVY